MQDCHALIIVTSIRRACLLGKCASPSFRKKLKPTDDDCVLIEIDPDSHKSAFDVQKEIDCLTSGYDSKLDYFVDKLSQGIAMIAGAFHPRPVILRFSDFKSNEYCNLLGGAGFEPHEENPMIGWRGASRYYHPDFREGFMLELEAVKKVRDEMGCAILMVSHDLNVVMRRSDRVICLNGHICCEGTPSDVSLAPEYQALFGVDNEGALALYHHEHDHTHDTVAVP